MSDQARLLYFKTVLLASLMVYKIKYVIGVLDIRLQQSTRQGKFILFFNVCKTYSERRLNDRKLLEHGFSTKRMNTIGLDDCCVDGGSALTQHCLYTVGNACLESFTSM